MKIKLFGKELFEFNKVNDMIMPSAHNVIRDSKYLPDFYRNISNRGMGVEWINDSVAETNSYTVLDSSVKTTKPKKNKETEQKTVKKLTPKDVYSLQLLNNKSFTINVDEDYVNKQVEDFKDKLSLLKSEEYDMQRGTDQIASVLTRMENRKKYANFKTFFEQYPYTTTAKINELVKEHNYLDIGQVAQFLADMPSEAVNIMKEYNKQTMDLCGKQAVYYIIADKEDFKETEKRRDPILLVQSPFGHFWQICGAWSDEMVLIEEL
ncbi:MAG: hypothetical protein WCX46_04195 [Candidatus Paceibacterota bacterium]